MVSSTMTIRMQADRKARFRMKFVATARGRLERAVRAFELGDSATVLHELHTLAGEAGLLGITASVHATAEAQAIVRRWADMEGGAELEAAWAQAVRTLAETVEAIVQDPAAVALPDPPTQVSTDSGRVLIIDDSTVALERMCAALSAEGHEIVGRTDASGALASIDTAAPRVVLLDLSIPGTQALCAALRERVPLVKIVLTSAQADQELAAEVVRLGAHSFVSKLGGMSPIVEHVRSLGPRATVSRPGAAVPRPSPNIASRFRSSSIERIRRIEAAWDALTHGVETDVASADLSRDLHTLAGDSRLLGLSSVALICNKLEALVALAREFNYDVPIELDLIVGTTTRLLDLLVLEGENRSGMDVVGFAAVLDDVIAVGTCEPVSRATTGDTRERLAHVLARAQVRLHSNRVVELAPLLESRAVAIPELARNAGKRAEAVLAVGELSVPESVADAVELAATHLMRNSIAHGIETPQVRAATGKPAAGTVWVRAKRTGDHVQVEFEDDGRGIDTVAVRTRAIRSGLLTEAEAEAATEVGLLPLLFKFGFSTSERVDELAGRGIGLDAVKTAVERVGGTISVSTNRGRGTTFRVSIPAERDH
jgi:signal transduction histidine kinase/DNA-binding response OmpR family regulator